jgi:hypothetical protein
MGEALPQPIDEAAELAAFFKRQQTEKKAFGKINIGLFFEPKVVSFTPKELRFLKEFGPHTTVDEAAKKAGVPVAVGNRILKSQKAREFLQDRFQQIAVQEGWTVERWFAEGDKVFRGLRVLTREQLDIWKEFGSRILPKRSSGAAEGGEKPQITINIGAVDEAFRRQQAIQAEVVDLGHGT